MLIIQGRVITRDKIYTAYGKTENEVLQLLQSTYENFVTNKVISTEEFMSKVEYDVILIGTVNIQDNTDTLYRSL